MQHTRKGELFTELVLEVFRLGGLLVEAGDELTKPQGLTSARWKILGALAYAPGPMTVSQIAAAMGQSRQGVLRLSDAMVADSILAYGDNPHHKTAKLVSLTAKSRLAYQALEAVQRFPGPTTAPPLSIPTTSPPHSQSYAPSQPSWNAES